MAVCLPCGHTVSEAQAPSWEYKDVTFYFCSLDCEEEVRGEPEKWLALAQSGAHEHTAHGHAHN